MSFIKLSALFVVTAVLAVAGIAQFGTASSPHSKLCCCGGPCECPVCAETCGDSCNCDACCCDGNGPCDCSDGCTCDGVCHCPDCPAGCCGTCGLDSSVNKCCDGACRDK